MPKAVIDFEETHHRDLKSCPGGYVELRRLSYGEKLHRQTIAMDASASGSGKQAKMTLQSMHQRVALFEFGRCIVDHNLEDAVGRKLDFKSQADLEKLHPQIGDEIDKYLSELNNFEETEAAEDFDSESDEA